MRRRSGFALVVLGAALTLASAASARVLRVGSFHGVKGQYESIQVAVDAAKPGDWVLIGPGDYKTISVRAPRGRPDLASGVLVTKRRVWIRGMNRNTVIVDGTRPGSPECSHKASAQSFGPAGNKGKRVGLNGIMVWKAADVWVENLTACNFLRGSGNTGNEVWWNGGDRSRGIGGHGFIGSYLTATSTFYGGERTAAQYGIFTSHWSGGTLDQLYASNFNDAGFYIGACQQLCDQVLNHGHAQFNALGYSGTNSGGRMLIENSEFDHNQDGFDTNSENTDFPSPQNGACPKENEISPITHTHSCWVFMHNFVHDNNDRSVPAAGLAAAGPVGTGMSISGGRNDTVIDNRFSGNDAWGVIVVNFPDSGNPCHGGTKNSPLLGKGSCLFDEWGDALIHNRFTGNGGYGNPTNGDFEQLNLEKHPSDCFRGNVDTSGALTPVSAQLEQTYPTCGTNPVAPNLNLPFLNEVLCDSSISAPPFGCQKGDRYPPRMRVAMQPLPKHLRSMPDPCAGVPSNPWCRPKRA